MKSHEKKEARSLSPAKTEETGPANVTTTEAEVTPEGYRVEEALAVLRRRARGTAAALRQAARTFDRIAQGETRLELPKGAAVRHAVADAASRASEGLSDPLAGRVFYALAGQAGGAT